MRALLPCLLSACTLVPPADPAPKAPAPEVSVAVLPVAAKNLEPRMTTMLTGVLTTEAHAAPGVRVTTVDDINATLELEKQRDLLDCDDALCMAEIGGALGVERILATSVGTVGGTHVVNMSLIDARTGRALARATEDGRGEPDVLIPLVRRAAHALFELPGDPPELPELPEPVVEKPEDAPVMNPPPRRERRPRAGGLTVTSLTANATVVVTTPSGRERSGRLPWSNDRLSPGDYRLEVRAPGHRSKNVRVRVIAGENNAVVVKLEPGSSSVVLEAPPESEPSVRASGAWLPCAVGQVLRGRACRGAPSSLTWDQAQYACPSGYGLPMHEELLALLRCGDSGCRSCADSHACREQFGNDRGRYWTASSVFGEAFVVDLGRGTVERISKSAPQRARCKRR